VTRVAVMSIAVTEPKSDGAAKLALKVNVVCSMLFAVFYSGAYTDGRTLRTDQFFSFELFKLILLSRVTVLHTTEIR